MHYLGKSTVVMTVLFTVAAMAMPTEHTHHAHSYERHNHSKSHIGA